MRLSRRASWRCRPVFSIFTLTAPKARSPAALKAICRKRTANDFRSLTPVRLGEYPTLEEVTQHGEFKYGPMKEAYESYRLKTYGKIIALTRQAIVNDDLGAFRDLAAQLGVMVGDSLSVTVTYCVAVAVLP